MSELLGGLGIGHYLPLVNVTRRYGHRRRVSAVPLFPSYVFLFGPVEASYRAIETRRIAGVIQVADQTGLERELRDLRRMIELEKALDPYPYLRVGRAVRVRTGPMEGIEGMVDERLGLDRLILSVHTLGQSVAVEIDAALVEVLG